jgi:hypothetical protein
MIWNREEDTAYSAAKDRKQSEITRHTMKRLARSEISVRKASETLRCLGIPDDEHEELMASYGIEMNEPVGVVLPHEDDRILNTMNDIALGKISIQEAKNVLRSFGIPDEDHDKAMAEYVVEPGVTPYRGKWKTLDMQDYLSCLCRASNELARSHAAPSGILREIVSDGSTEEAAEEAIRNLKMEQANDHDELGRYRSATAIVMLMLSRIGDPSMIKVVREWDKTVPYSHNLVDGLPRGTDKTDAASSEESSEELLEDNRAIRIATARAINGLRHLSSDDYDSAQYSASRQELAASMIHIMLKSIGGRFKVASDEWCIVEAHPPDCNVEKSEPKTAHHASAIRGATARLERMRGKNHSDKDAADVIKLMLEEFGDPYYGVLDAWERINWTHHACKDGTRVTWDTQGERVVQKLSSDEWDKTTVPERSDSAESSEKPLDYNRAIRTAMSENKADGVRRFARWLDRCVQEGIVNGELPVRPLYVFYFYPDDEIDSEYPDVARIVELGKSFDT